MTRHRVAYLCADRGIPIDGTKGASVHFREMGQAMSRSGFDVHAVVRRRLSESTSPVPVPFPVAVASPRPEGRKERAGVVGELGELIRQEDLVSALASLPAPHLVYERYSLFGLAGLQHSRRHGVPFVLEVNAPLWEEAARYRNLELVGLARSVARELLWGADLILAVSPRLRRRLIEEGAPPERTRVFPNGVAPEFVRGTSVAARPSVFGDRPVVVFVGSLKPWHGLEFLLEALERGTLGEAALWIVGDGPLRDQVARAAERRPDRVRWEGAIAHDGVAAILRASDAAVAPYLADSPDYFCPLKVFEALCAGTRLLASAVPAVREVVPAPAPIHWFEPGDPLDLGRALRDALSSRDSADRFDAHAHTWDARARELHEWVSSATALSRVS